MSVQPQPRMTVDEFLAWTEGRDGKFELYDGEVFATSPQCVRHVQTRACVQSALKTAIERAGLPCEMLPNGVAVRIDARTAYEPGALVQCGDPLPDEAIETIPIIVVEVVPTSVPFLDTSLKLSGYFRVPSVVHYLVVDPAAPIVIHYRRGSNDTIETRIVATGSLDLDPPGLTLAIADLFAEP